VNKIKSNGYVCSENMGVSAKIYARIGELMQGVLPDGSAFLVSGLSSRRWYSEAVVEEGVAVGSDGIAVAEWPVLPPKAASALAILLLEGRSVLPADVGVRLQSNIPKGKGLSSSSTDVLSVLAAVNTYLGIGLDAEGLYSIAARIEPTDPCLSNDIRIFHQHSGKSGAIIGLPPVTLLYFDAAPDRAIETLALGRNWPEYAGGSYAWLLRRLLDAAAEGDHPRLFDCVSRSAEYNQAMLPLPGFSVYRRLAAECGAGLLVAHSGTIAGLLVRPDDAAALLPRVEAMAPSAVFTEQYSSPHTPLTCRPYYVR
jgi:uncharacterized protein involved in propanediol utilization